MAKITIEARIQELAQLQQRGAQIYLDLLTHAKNPTDHDRIFAEIRQLQTGTHASVDQNDSMAKEEKSTTWHQPLLITDLLQFDFRKFSPENLRYASQIIQKSDDEHALYAKAFVEQKKSSAMIEPIKPALERRIQTIGRSSKDATEHDFESTGTRSRSSGVSGEFAVTTRERSRSVRFEVDVPDAPASKRSSYGAMMKKTGQSIDPTASKKDYQAYLAGLLEQEYNKEQPSSPVIDQKIHQDIESPTNFQDLADQYAKDFGLQTLKNDYDAFKDMSLEDKAKHKFYQTRMLDQIEQSIRVNHTKEITSSQEKNMDVSIPLFKESLFKFITDPNQDTASSLKNALTVIEVANPKGSFATFIKESKNRVEKAMEDPEQSQTSSMSLG